MQCPWAQETVGEAEQGEIVPSLGGVGTVQVTRGRGPLHRASGRGGQDHVTNAQKPPGEGSHSVGLGGDP